MRNATEEVDQECNAALVDEGLGFTLFCVPFIFPKVRVNEEKFALTVVFLSFDYRRSREEMGTISACPPCAVRSYFRFGFLAIDSS